jgi:hypothetical protein
MKKYWRETAMVCCKVSQYLSGITEEICRILSWLSESSQESNKVSFKFKPRTVVNSPCCRKMYVVFNLYFICILYSRSSIGSFSGDLVFHDVSSNHSSLSFSCWFSILCEHSDVLSNRHALMVTRILQVYDEEVPPPKRYSCPMCNMEFAQVSLLQYHVDTCLEWHEEGTIPMFLYLTIPVNAGWWKGNYLQVVYR